MRRRLVLLPPTVLLAVLAGACGGDDPTTSRSPGPTVDLAPTPTASRSVSPSPTSTVRTIRVVVADGKVTEGDSRIDVRIGETVRIQVVSDTADEVHVHGYDEEFAVGPGRPGVLELRITIPGSFPVELHEAELVLFQLRAR